MLKVASVLAVLLIWWGVFKLIAVLNKRFYPPFGTKKRDSE